MQIRLGSPTVKILLSIGAFMLLFGSVFSTINNAKNIITPNLTYILTGIVLASIPFILILERVGVLNITYPDGSIFSISDIRPLAVIVALLVVLWLPRAFAPAIQKDVGVITQKGILEIQRTETYEVFYPQPFSTTPNLTFSKMVDHHYYSVGYEVIEQRRDGFKINITFTSIPAAIEWWAEGTIDTSKASNK